MTGAGGGDMEDLPNGTIPAGALVTCDQRTVPHTLDTHGICHNPALAPPKASETFMAMLRRNMKKHADLLERLRHG